MLQVRIHGRGSQGGVAVAELLSLEALEEDALMDPTGAYMYAYDLDHCKGCGVYAEECPCAAIAMEPETI